MNTAYFLNLVAQKVFIGTGNLPGAYYLALSKNASGQTVSEPSASYGYARQPLTLSMLSGADGVATNQSAIDFPEATGGSWETVKSFAIYDSAARGTGNLLMYGSLDPARSVTAGTRLTIKENDLRLSVSNP